MIRKFKYVLVLGVLLTVVVMAYVSVGGNIQYRIADRIGDEQLEVGDNAQHTRHDINDDFDDDYDDKLDSFVSQLSEHINSNASNITSVTMEENYENSSTELSPTSIVAGANQTQTKKKLINKYRPYHTIFAQNRSSWACSIPSSGQPEVSVDWQDVMIKNTHVYSAFLDPRIDFAIVVRVFGIMKSEEFLEMNEPRNRYYCQAWTPGRDVTITTEAHLILAGRRLGRYMPLQLECRFPKGKDFEYTTVSVMTHPCETPSNAMVILTPYKTGFVRDFAICVSGPLKHEYNDTTQFVEWMEINLLLGAGMIYMYQYLIGDNLLPYIRYYEAQGVLQVLPWSLPIYMGRGDHQFRAFKLIWNYGQELTIQDCMYRNMYASRYVASMDLDELIVPRGGLNNWKEMLQAAECQEDPPLYTFRNVFFHTGSTSDEILGRNTTITKTLKLIKLLKVLRQKQPNKHNDRSKYIAIPERMKLAHIHKVFQTWNNGKACIVGENTGLLHHYRDWPYLKDTVVDVTLHKYKESIIKRTLNVHLQVAKE